MVIVVVAHRNINAAANSATVSRVVWSHYQNVIITYLVQDTKSNDLTVQIYYSFDLRGLKKISNEISMSITRPYSKITKKRRRGGGSLTYHIFIFTVISLQSDIGFVLVCLFCWSACCCRRTEVSCSCTSRSKNGTRC
jgi:hypothetical protein